MAVRPFERGTSTVQHPSQVYAVAVHDVPIQANCADGSNDELLHSFGSVAGVVCKR